MVTFFIFLFLIVVFIAFMYDVEHNRKRNDNSEKHRYHFILDDKNIIVIMNVDDKLDDYELNDIKNEMVQKFNCKKDEIGVVYYGKS